MLLSLSASNEHICRRCKRLTFWYHGCMFKKHLGLHSCSSICLPTSKEEKNYNLRLSLLAQIWYISPRLKAIILVTNYQLQYLNCIFKIRSETSYALLLFSAPKPGYSHRMLYKSPLAQISLDISRCERRSLKYLFKCILNRFMLFWFSRPPK